jgi:hypothetical protein
VIPGTVIPCAGAKVGTRGGGAWRPARLVHDDMGMSPSQPDDQIPSGMTTLRMWGPGHGRSGDYIRRNWRNRDGFPPPSGVLPPRGRNGGGRGELLFYQAELDAWIAAHPDSATPERVDPAATQIDPSERITLGRFAALIGKARKTVTQHRDRAGFPEADADALYRPGDLLDYWNSRSGRRGPTRRQ